MGCARAHSNAHPCFIFSSYPPLVAINTGAATAVFAVDTSFGVSVSTLVRRLSCPCVVLTQCHTLFDITICLFPLVAPSSPVQHKFRPQTRLRAESRIGLNAVLVLGFSLCFSLYFFYLLSPRLAIVRAYISGAHQHNAAAPADSARLLQTAARLGVRGRGLSARARRRGRDTVTGLATVWRHGGTPDAARPLHAAARWGRKVGITPAQSVRCTQQARRRHRSAL